MRADHSTELRAARALKTAQGRRQQGRYLLEGVRLVEDALQQGLVPEVVFVTPHLLETTPRGQELSWRLRRSGPPPIELSARLMTLISDTETPPGIIAVAGLPRPGAGLPYPAAGGLTALLLDQVRDPGNVGGIMRTAAAAGLELVVSSEGTVDLYAPKVVRAGAGAHLRLAVRPARPPEDLVPWLDGWPQVVVADGRARTGIYDVDWRIPTVLVLSNEAHGAADWLEQTPARRVAVPMRRGTDSLNVAAAAAVFLYEARRHSLA